MSGVNESSKVIHYSLGPGHLSGIIRYDQTDIRPNVGDSLRISYYVREKKDADRPLAKKKIIEVLKVESTTEINTNAVREFTGTLEVKYYDRDRYWDCDPDSESLPDFAFVGDYFVHKSLLEAKRITGDCRVKGKAVYAGDKKWKTFSLDVI